ncbi:hypothetical protein [Pseudomonas syringae]|uniref:hypothetical protein n=5 Tax=Pseudomonas syringae TaxID=317 RepID=UPI001F1D64FF|nr:hypothetical protein [Pseudomonas syringae]MCF5467832.1 hypothetical protein [Pseudomonas syringae]MCF5472357.1 hypothetical protein [Pseudomonas syringae]MCF5481665.1 hypothetical protein [Pseudomonas syringae]MCF5488092.1 hypothetical protein [Pseudomonas syringae]MCF5494013.1 hypothetical protein [Pseudomonas syringae]
MAGDHGRAGATLATALNPDSCLVDGRDHRDRMAFAAEFAKLIVYYDKTNQAAGDWRQFFMKEPAILMAAISHAEPESYYSTFSPARTSGLQAIEAPDPAEFAAVSQLCMLSTHMFSMLNQWYQWMDLAPKAYVLHGFLKTRIETSLADQLWTMVRLQLTLSLFSRGQVEAPDAGLFKGFDKVWGGKRTAPAPPEDTDIPAGLAGLQVVYGAVFSVFTQVIDYARQAFEASENQPTGFADTALLMVFSRLMAVQQQNINQLGRKHLDFYYRQILQQVPKPAQADAVYVCLTLAPRTDAFNLPAATTFKAGTYPDGSDIVFSNDEPVQLNRVRINTLSTLYYLDDAANSGWYSSTVANVDKPGSALVQGLHAWETLGDAKAVVVQPGFAIASPMLLLQSGTRSITLQMQLAGTDASISVLKADNTAYFLSTGKAWLQVVPTTPVSVTASGLVTLKLDLKASDPPIIAFASAMDGAVSPWPRLKVLPQLTGQANAPPTLVSVAITVSVTGFRQLVMANDNSALPATGRALTFGSLPKSGSGFYVGSNECFAKPLTDLALTIIWDGLPADFRLYYAAFNQYLSPGDSGLESRFDNEAFKVCWQVLHDGKWSALLLTGQSENTRSALFQFPASNSNSNSSTFSFQLDTARAVPVKLALAPLAALRQASDGYISMQLVEPVDAFGHDLYARVAASVTLHNAQVLINGANAKGASYSTRLGQAIKAGWSALKAKIKRVLGRSVAPDAGAPLTSVPSDTFQDMPNLPYTPAQQAVSLDYTASMTVDIQPRQAAVSSPLAIYHYGPFTTDLAYDAHATDQAADQSNTALPLYPVTGSGWLYLALSEAMTSTLSLFIGVLSDENIDEPDDSSLVCQCWTAGGWRALQVLQDDTANLRTCGMIRLAIAEPQTATDDSVSALPLMQAEGFWLAIARPRNSCKITYVNTQAVKLRRSTVAGLPAGTVPAIEAGAIVATQQKVRQVAGVVQPFASFAGLPAEDQSGFDQPASFYRRVATRLNHKDRAQSGGHYASLAYEAYPDLYYATAMPSAEQPGGVVIGLVNGYASADVHDAFRPQVSAASLNVIEQFLVRRASAMSRIRVQNLQHQTVTIIASLVVSPQTNANALYQVLNQQLRVYLSPWIVSDRPQMDIAKGLSRTELITFLKADANVLAVSSLEILRTSPGHVEELITDDPVLPEPYAVLVSADHHKLKSTARSTLQEVSHG